ncbi:CAP domain-containing protein [Halobacteriales archaeon Cl-PHB]
MFRAVVGAVKLGGWVVLLVGTVSLSMGTGISALDSSVDEVATDVMAAVESLDLSSVSGIGSSPDDTHPPAGQHSEYERAIAREIHQQINDVRTDRGRGTLVYSEELAAIGRYHSDDMAARDYFAHTGPDGQTLSDRYDRFDYDCRATIDAFTYATGGENIYKSVASSRRPAEEVASEAVQGWLDSPSHRENLLKPYWEKEGLGVNVSREEGQTVIFVTQNFC